MLAISGIASAVATLLLLTWAARPAADADALANGRSGESAGVDGGIGGDGVSTGASASTVSTASVEETAALARARAEDPATGLRSAAGLRAADERRRAVLAVGKRWASTDPEAALAMASTLPSILRVDYRAIVSREWANLDPDGFLRFAESAPDREALLAGLELLIASEPVRVFEIVGRLGHGESYWTVMQFATAAAMAEQDVTLALQAHDSAPRGMASDAFLSATLTSFGHKDPDAALAWLESFDSPSPSMQAAVFHGIAQTDFERAYRLLTEEFPAALSSPGALDELVSRAVQDPASASRAAEALLEIGTDRAGQVLQEVAGTWAQRDPESLVDWMVENAATIQPQLARSIGLGIATSDLESALDLVDRLPPSIGNAWVPQIAGSYARQDPLAALDWIARYQGQAFYDEARSQAVLRAAESDPELVASMLPGMPATLQASAVPNIATAWVQRDPRAAAAWAAGLEGAVAEAGAAGLVVRDWMRRDLDAATRWSLDLPRGRMRDEALANLIGGSYGVNFDPRPIFEEIESPDMRRSAVFGAAISKRSTDPDLARHFYELLLDDEVYGESARRALEGLPARN